MQPYITQPILLLVQSWPPCSSDVPNDWGAITADNNSIPELFTISALVFCGGCVQFLVVA